MQCINPSQTPLTHRECIANFLAPLDQSIALKGPYRPSINPLEQKGQVPVALGDTLSWAAPGLNKV